MIQRSVTLHRFLVAAALVLALSPVGTAAAQQAEARFVRVYETRFLGAETALRLAHAVCSDAGRDACSVEAIGPLSVSVSTSQAIHERIATLLGEQDVPPATREFRVILLRADASGRVADLPAGAEAALDDLRSVTHFTGFEVIDTALMRTAERAETQLGPLGAFGVEIFFEGDPRRDAELLVRFALAYTPGHKVATIQEGEIEVPYVEYGNPRSLMSATFGIRSGETVVVGTSRLNGGDEALVALLTSVER